MSLDSLHDTIADITERYRAAGYFPSASVSVFDLYGELVHYDTGDGAKDALYDVASLTKIATTAQILHLIQQGKLSLDHSIVSLLPSLARDDVLRMRCQPITVRMLLTHTSTLPAWYPFYTQKGKDFYDVLSLALSTTPVSTGVCYSDLNFMLLGKVIEEIQQKPLETCLQEDLVKRFHLGDMMYKPGSDRKIVPSDYGNAIEMRMVKERGLTFDEFRPLGTPVRGSVNDGNCHYFFDGVAGHAGIFATTEAYMRLCQHFMKSPSKYFLAAQETQQNAPGRGLGLQTGLTYPNGCGHTGFTGTSIYFSKQDEIGVILFTNRLFYPEGNELPTGDYRRVMHEIVHAFRT